MRPAVSDHSDAQVRTRIFAVPTVTSARVRRGWGKASKLVQAYVSFRSEQDGADVDGVELACIQDVEHDNPL